MKQLSKTTFNDIRVLVIGDVMIDQYMFGKVYRNSPEADIPVLEDVNISTKLGGAANVAQNFISLGAKCELLSISGADSNSSKLSELLQEASIKSYIVTDTSRPTTVKTRVFQDNHQLIRIDQESTEEVNDSTLRKLKSQLSTAIQEFRPQIIVLQDYNKGIFSENFIKLCINTAKQHGLYVSVDPKKKHFDIYQQVDLFKPNINELADFTGLQNHNNASIEEIQANVNMLRSKLNAKTVLATLSERGAIIQKQNSSLYSNAEPIDVVDVCGAGDAVLSIVTLADYMKFSNEDILSLCNKSGRIVCQKTGVAGISIDEILA